MLRRAFLAALVGLVVAGCGDLFGPEGHKFIIITETEYRLEVLPDDRLGLTVPYTIMNLGGEPVSVSVNCGWLMWNDGVAWSFPEGMEQPFRPDCGDARIEVGKGDVFQFTARFDVPRPTAPHELDHLIGAYRVFMDHVYDSDGELLPAKDLFSKPFSVRMP